MENVLTVDDLYLFVDPNRTNTICFTNDYGIITKFPLNLSKIHVIELFHHNSFLLCGTGDGLYAFDINLDQKVIDPNSKIKLHDNSIVFSLLSFDTYFIVYDLQDEARERFFYLTKYKKKQGERSFQKINSIKQVDIHECFKPKSPEEWSFPAYLMRKDEDSFYFYQGVQILNIYVKEFPSFSQDFEFDEDESIKSICSYNTSTFISSQNDSNSSMTIVMNDDTYGLEHMTQCDRILHDEKQIMIGFQKGGNNSMIIMFTNKETLHSEFILLYPTIPGNKHIDGKPSFCELFVKKKSIIKLWKWNVERKELFLMDEDGKIDIVKRRFCWNNHVFHKFYIHLMERNFMENKKNENDSEDSDDDSTESISNFSYTKFCMDHDHKRRWNILIDDILRYAENSLYKNDDDESDKEDVDHLTDCKKDYFVEYKRRYIFMKTIQDNEKNKRELDHDIVCFETNTDLILNTDDFKKQIKEDLLYIYDHTHNNQDMRMKLLKTYLYGSLGENEKNHEFA